MLLPKEGQSVALIFLIFSILLFSLPSVQATVFSKGSFQNQFLVISDIHYDPSYNSSLNPSTFCRKSINPGCDDNSTLPLPGNNTYFGQWNCDTPFSLMTATFQAMQQQIAKPDFILALGDFAVHCTDSYNETLDALRNASAVLQLYFPGVPIYPVIGNNDVFPSTQIPDGPSLLLNDIGAAWSEFLPADAMQTFLQGGYYSVVPRPGLRIIALNTVYYMDKWCPSNTTVCTDAYEPTTADPANQFVFLADTLLLASASKQKVYIIAHSGPEPSRGFDTQWRDEYLPHFLNLTEGFKDIIEGIFVGHIHRDSFAVQLNRTLEGQTAIFVASSVTPRSENNPSFRLVNYDPNASFRISDYATYYLDLDKVIASPAGMRNVSQVANMYQLEYWFSKAYLESQPLTPETLARLVRVFDSDSDLLEEWISRWASMAVEADSSKHPPAMYLCAMISVNNVEAERCFAEIQKSRRFIS